MTIVLCGNQYLQLSTQWQTTWFRWLPNKKADRVYRVCLPQAVVKRFTISDDFWTCVIYPDMSSFANQVTTMIFSDV